MMILINSTLIYLFDDLYRNDVAFIEFNLAIKPMN